MNPVDLRSDTVTVPNEEMRLAIFKAEVGDDVFGEDPTVNKLEEQAAEIIGKEAAVLIPSGTMGNQIAVAVHTSPGQEVICDQNAHIMLYEMGMLARLSGCLSRTISTQDGLLNWDLISSQLRSSSDHFKGTGLIELENTHNAAGGRVYKQQAVEEICTKSHAAGVPVHMDGARIFHAATALGVPVNEVASPVDSVMFCLSKGLGAPVGSMLAGSSAFIAEARLVRKALGGGMRQAGILAAAGIVALEQGPKTIPEAHDNARYLALSLSQIPSIGLDLASVETNIVFFDITATGLTNEEFLGALKESGVLALGLRPGRIRMVTHRDLDRSDCERAVEAITAACSLPAVVV